MPILRHIFLTKASNLKEAKDSVYHFITHYKLIHYDEFQILVEEITSGVDENFWPLLKEGIEKNKAILLNLLWELEKEGFTSLAELQDLPQGYLSKVFHTIAHFLDGFFGIDSYFYNLVEDSHWISPSLRRDLKLDPQSYYLIPCEATIREAERRFEALLPKNFFK